MKIKQKLIDQSKIKMAKIKYNFTPFPELKTERLLLRQLTEADSQDIFFLRTDKGVNRYIERPRPENINDARDFILKTNNSIKQNEWIDWAIALKDAKKLIGTICLWNFSEDKTRAEVGFELKPDYQGKGIMNEALVNVLKFGFETIGLASIDAYTHKDNINSTKLLLKNDFKPDIERKDNENINNIIFTRTN